MQFNQPDVVLSTTCFYAISLLSLSDWPLRSFLCSHLLNFCWLIIERAIWWWNGHMNMWSAGQFETSPLTILSLLDFEVNSDRLGNVRFWVNFSSDVIEDENVQAVFYCIRGLSRLVCFYSFIWMTFFRVTCNMNSICGLWCKVLGSVQSVCSSPSFYIIARNSKCPSWTRFTLIERFRRNNVAGGQWRISQTNQKLIYTHYHLSSHHMEYKTHSVPGNWVRSLNKLSFKFLFLSRLVVVSIEFDSSVIAER